MQSHTRMIWAILAVVGLSGCHHTGRSSLPWRAQRMPPWPTPMAPAAPANSPWSQNAATPADKSVPIPERDPQRSGGANLSNQIETREESAPQPNAAESPQIRLKPVAPNGDLDPPPTQGTGVQPDVEDLPAPLVVPKRNQPEPAADSSSKSAGPSLGFEPLPAPNDSVLSLNVRGQRQRPVGGAATFDVVVRNNGTEPLDGVVINVEFDEAFVFPGRTEKQLKKVVGRLMPGQSREMRLTLTSNQLGKHDCRFVVVADGIAATEQAAIVDFVNPKLQVELIGPARRTIGSRAEFTVKIANASDKAIDDLHVALQHDAALTPHLATGGFQKAGHSLNWSLGRLEAGAGIQVQAEFDCRRLSEQACITATVRGAELSAEEVESCLTVVAVPGLLDLRVSDRTDPVKVGEEAEYEITVQNLGLQAIAEVQLEVQTSEHLRVETHSAKVGDRAVALTATPRRDGTLRLVFTDPLLPDGTLRVTLNAGAKLAGDAELRVVATSGTDGTPTEASEFTSINP